MALDKWTPSDALAVMLLKTWAQILHCIQPALGYSEMVVAACPQHNVEQDPALTCGAGITALTAVLSFTQAPARPNPPPPSLLPH